MDLKKITTECDEATAMMKFKYLIKYQTKLIFQHSGQFAFGKVQFPVHRGMASDYILNIKQAFFRTSF